MSYTGPEQKPFIDYTMGCDGTIEFPAETTQAPNTPPRPVLSDEYLNALANTGLRTLGE